MVRFTNNGWVIDPASFHQSIGVCQHQIINDFAAVAQAVAHADTADFIHLAGPDRELPQAGVISIIGPGTGLGVAQLWRHEAGYRVQPTEGGHMDFAPIDAVEAALVTRLRERHGRVSVERVVAGPGLAAIYETLAAQRGQTVAIRDDTALWAAGIAGEDDLAAAAVDRFCQSLGSVSGDLVLAHGACALVLAGGVGLRLLNKLPRSGFAERFQAKGRFGAMMAAVPVKLMIHPQPGLFGAAAGFAQAHRG